MVDSISPDLAHREPAHRDSGPRVLGGRYEVGELIGRGGMAEVHIGHDTRLGRTVAIKILRSDLARDPAFLARFQREAQSAASLNYPAIVAVYDSGEDTYIDPTTGASVHVPYIVMEYVEGHTVRDILNHGDAVPIDEAVEITSGVLSALDYSHHAGIIHRDIKPGNVMITPTGAVKVMDFGIARAVADSAATMTQTQAVIGTAQYLSPEQARGETVDARSDIYSTGCLLFELLTGRPPFVGDSPVAVAYQHVGQAPLAPSDFAADVPPELDRITLKALAKERSQRYTSAADFRADLDAFLAGQTPSASTVHIGVPGVAPTQVYHPVAQTTTPAYGATQVMHPGVGDTVHMGAVPDVGATAVYHGSPFAPVHGGSAVPNTPPVAEAVLPGTHPPATQWGPLHQDVAEPHLAEPPVVEEPKSKVWLWVLIPLLIIGAGLAAFFLLRGGGGEPEPALITVPTFTEGVTQDQACEQLKQLTLDCEPRFDENSNAPEGTFLRQDPLGGTQLETGQSVILYFSGGPSLVSVPGLEGMTADQARDRLAEVGLVLGEVRLEPHPNIPEGLVIRSLPEANITVNRGDTVAVYLSNGLVDLPDLRGQQEQQAIATLNSMNLAHRVIPEPSATHPAGIVISQSPSAGLIDQGSEVTLTVATEPEVENLTVPGVAGQSCTAAVSSLVSAGFNVGASDNQFNDDGVPAGTAIGTRPGEGSEVAPGTTIIVVCSMGPTPPTPEQQCTSEGNFWINNSCVAACAYDPQIPSTSDGCVAPGGGGEGGDQGGEGVPGSAPVTPDRRGFLRNTPVDEPDESAGTDG